MGSRVVGAKYTVALKVLMNGQLVGDLRKSSSGAMSFQYAQEWLETAGARPVSLSLPLKSAAYEGDRVYNFFDNLLPDSQLIRARIQARFKVSSSQPFDLLAAIGADCVGAIQLYPEQSGGSVRSIIGKALSTEEIAGLLEGYKTAPLGMIEGADDFRISVAGAQEKTALLWYQEHWCRPSGTTPTTHIFKLPIGVISHNNIDLSTSCENEWLCLEIAKAYGFETAHAEIQQFEGVKALVVERFDRRWSTDGRWLMRLPQEDMCQALGVSPNLKYQSDGGPGIAEIMQVLLGSRNADADRETFFRSQILFWLLAATDGHAKNFSIYIEPSGRYRLTPMYDVISAYPLMQTNDLPKQKVKMAMALRGTKKNIYDWSMIQPRHFLSMAKQVNFSAKRAERILVEMLTQVGQVTEKVIGTLPANFPIEISKPILKGMASLAQTRLKGLDFLDKSEEAL
jgi:serine/threonine-protein kinase HipA